METKPKIKRLTRGERLNAALVSLRVLRSRCIKNSLDFFALTLAIESIALVWCVGFDDSIGDVLARVKEALINFEREAKKNRAA